MIGTIISLTILCILIGCTYNYIKKVEDAFEKECEEDDENEDNDLED